MHRLSSKYNETELMSGASFFGLQRNNVWPMIHCQQLPLAAHDTLSTTTIGFTIRRLGLSAQISNVSHIRATRIKNRVVH